jgi:hypothetical protein
MKIRTIKAVLLSVAFFASLAIFTSCDGEKKEEGAANETPEVEQVDDKADPKVEDTPEVTPLDTTTDVNDDASVEAEPVKEEAPVVEKKEVAKVEPVKKVETKVEEVVVEAVAEAKPSMTFDHTSYEFGTINQGESVTHLFTFTNTGDAPLVINNARPSCGCTVPSWPKEPIMPGETGEIKAVFNSRGKSGKQHKSIRITTNMGDQPSTIFLTGNVIIPAPEPTSDTPAE